jgi:selenocysteine lyase/cysteine desulfurase
VVCSHITTNTGLVVPIKGLSDLAHARGALIAFDGAHGPGMIPLDLAGSACDFYGGNCHKWLCAPKGTGFLYAAPSVQERLHHIVVSWGYSREGPKTDDEGRLRIQDRPFMWELENWGTRDLAGLAAVGTAVDFQEAVGKGRVAARGRVLAGYLRSRMAQKGWAELITPSVPSMSGSISAFHFRGLGDVALSRYLYDRARISVPTREIEDGHWMRVSTHLYNSFEQVDRLTEELETLRKDA